MKLIRLALISAAAALLAGSALGPPIAQGACPPAQPCPNGPRVPFPVISPVQNLNNLTERLKQQREQPQVTQPVPWNYVPTATPPQNLPPNLRPQP